MAVKVLVVDDASHFAKNLNAILLKSPDVEYNSKNFIAVEELKNAQNSGSAFDAIIIPCGSSIEPIFVGLKEEKCSHDESVIIVFNLAAKPDDLCVHLGTKAPIVRVADPCESWKYPESYAIVHKPPKLPENIALIVKKLLSRVYTNVHILTEEKDFVAASLYCKFLTSSLVIFKTCLQDKTIEICSGDKYDENSIIAQSFVSLGKLINHTGDSCEDLVSAVSTPGGITATFTNKMEENGIHKVLKELLHDIKAL